MRSTGRQGSLLAAIALSIAVLQLFWTAITVDARSTSAAFVKKTPLPINHATTILKLRGGVSSSAVDIDMDDIESSDEEEEEEDDEEEEAALDPKLAKSAQAASSKVKAGAAKAAANASKAAVAATLKKDKTTKSSSNSIFRVPYIIKACLNPFVFLQMTSGYWKSLFNYKFEETLKDSSSDLRNSLQDKAKKGGGSSSSRKKRKMKPGQAKTLSDLPQLNT